MANSKENTSNSTSSINDKRKLNKKGLRLSRKLEDDDRIVTVFHDVSKIDEAKALVDLVHPGSILNSITVPGVHPTLAKIDVCLKDVAADPHSLLSNLVSLFDDNMISVSKKEDAESGREALKLMIKVLDSDVSHPFSTLGLLLGMYNESGMRYEGQRVEGRGEAKATDTGVFQIVSSTFKGIKRKINSSNKVFSWSVPPNKVRMINNTYVEYRKDKGRRPPIYDDKSPCTLDARPIYDQLICWLIELFFNWQQTKRHLPRVGISRLTAEPVYGWGVKYATIDFSRSNKKANDGGVFRDPVFERMYDRLYSVTILGKSYSFSDLSNITSLLDSSVEMFSIVNTNFPYDFGQSSINFSSLMNGKGIDMFTSSSDNGHLKARFNTKIGWGYTGNPWRILIETLVMEGRNLKAYAPSQGDELYTKYVDRTVGRTREVLAYPASIPGTTFKTDREFSSPGIVVVDFSSNKITTDTQ